VISPGHFREGIAGFIRGTRCAVMEPAGHANHWLLRLPTEDSFVLEWHFRCAFLLSSHQFRRHHMVLSAHLQPIVALIAGVLILIMPRLLNFIVAIYLILIGIIGLGIIK
jgi:hypothetical protein